MKNHHSLYLLIINQISEKYLAQVTAIQRCSQIRNIRQKIKIT
jgi:hypothetical protein